jgi:hypothetical protein
MKASLALAMAVLIAMAAPTLSATLNLDAPNRDGHLASHHARALRATRSLEPNVAIAPSSSNGLPFQWPHIAPFPQGQGHPDGLSRNTEDCNMGCIDY